MTVHRVLTILLLCLSPLAAHAETPTLGATKLYTQTVHDCSDVDLATWHHPTATVLDQAQMHLSKVQLCNDRTYPVFTVAPKFDPRGNTTAFYHRLYVKLAEANGWWSYALIDDADKVIITVNVSKSLRDLTIDYADFQ